MAWSVTEPGSGAQLRLVTYEVTIEMIYLAGRETLPESARAALASSTSSNLSAMTNAQIVVVSLDVTARPSGHTRLVALVAGTNLAALTSPVDAVACVDAALNRALMVGGMFEEFDVASRTLTVRPAARARG
jgi:hypothetical protein